MGSASFTGVMKANQGADQTVSRSCPSGQFTAAIMRKAHDIFRRKIPEELALRADIAVRTAYRWKKGERAIGLDEYLALLQGREAVEFLEVFWQFVPEQARERWINHQLLAREIAETERKAAEGRKKIDQLRFELKIGEGR